MIAAFALSLSLSAQPIEIKPWSLILLVKNLNDGTPAVLVLDTYKTKNECEADQKPYLETLSLTDNIFKHKNDVVEAQSIGCVILNEVVV